MNRFLIPLVILLGSFLYSLFWNQARRPFCTNNTEEAIVEEVVVEEALPPVTETDTTQPDLTPVEKALFEPLDIYFQSGSPNIIRTQELNDWLALAKKYLAENPGEKLSLTGHTDSDGSDELNQRLSENRAAKVRDILVADGFSSTNLETSGKGETQPIADNGTPEGKQKNRRVSIRLIK
ncbi:MAG: OmpA family protein [Leadbetterella sp.]|nr:OmpA family protein [Leadbetterella sp.]